ncbi:MAG TPA: thiamine pyrophosphate-dependent enzyme, partial [bacterium]|nr:thiamine pyrophosphate-dependent enzyme [bacterium]
ELGIEPRHLVMVSGIGQAAKIPQYLRCHYFNGLHGRALPPATAIKAANPGLTVIAASGDGCTYGEGGNHFIHAIRRNPDIAHLVHNNMVYGLTKGQASPTSAPGFRTPVQVHGVYEEPLNPVALAVALNASFVARAFIGDPDGTREIVKRAITHRGYALVDILQPCVSYNDLNTYAWFREHTYPLGADHDPSDQEAAFRRALETEKLPLGVFYVNPAHPQPFDEEVRRFQPEKKAPLYLRNLDSAKLRDLISSVGRR